MKASIPDLLRLARDKDSAVRLTVVETLRQRQFKNVYKSPRLRNPRPESSPQALGRSSRAGQQAWIDLGGVAGAKRVVGFTNFDE